MYDPLSSGRERRFALSPYQALETQRAAGPDEAGLDDYGAGDAKAAAQAPYALGVGRPSVCAYSGSLSQPGQLGIGRSPGAPLRPLRVIHVAQYMVRAGVDSWLKALIRASDPASLRWLRCIVTSDIGDAEVMRELGVPVEVGQASAVRRAAQDCDVLLVSSPAELGEWLGELRPGLCVFVTHGDSHWSRKILEQSRPVIDHVIAVSRRARDAVSHDFPCSVIYNGVDAAHLTSSRPACEVRTALGFSSGDFVVGYVGRFASEKRPEAILEAVATLPRRFKALLVGWGPLRHKLMDLANHLLPGRYAFVRADRDLGDLYRSMDALCLASESEGFGLVLLEAMLCGTPVISGRIGFAPEKLTHRINGLVVDGGPASIARAAQLLARHPRWAAALAQEGQRLAEQFGYATRMCREYEDLLHRLWTAEHGPLSATESSPQHGLPKRN
jgi:hypothetical protein